MGLLNNGLRETLTGRMFGSTNVNGGNPHSQEYRGHMAARMRNQFIGQGITDQMASIPSGVRHPVAWVMAPKNGAMSSRNNAVLSITTTGTVLGGVTTAASASFSIVTNTPAGQLISSGAGTASFAFTANSPLLTASIGGAGAAAFSIGANTPLLGALAEMAGTSLFSVTATNSQRYPLDDTPPARTGTASFSFSGSLQPYAIGNMSGSTVDASVLTVDAIAAAVLAAALTSPIAANIKKVKDQTITGAGTEASPWRP